MTAPHEPLGLLIVAARQAIRQAICTRARAHRLTGQQFWAIVALHRTPGLSPGDLAHLLLLDAPAASRLVALLSGRSLLEARPDRADRRRTHLHLTASGEALAAELAAIADEFQGALVRGLSPSELDVLRRGLGRVVENLATFESAPASPPAEQTDLDAANVRPARSA
jgi:DNA-binding MarR family transcriptional regulator